MYKPEIGVLLEQIMNLNRRRKHENSEYHICFASRAIIIRNLMIALLLVLSFSSCSKDRENQVKGDIDSLQTRQEALFFGSLWVHGFDMDYQPMFASKTKHEEDFGDRYLPMDSGKFTFIYDSPLPDMISYTVYKSGREAMETGVVGDLVFDQDLKEYIFDIFLEGDYKEEESYELEFTFSSQNEKAYYYTGLVVSDKYNSDRGISRLMEYMKQTFKTDNISIVDQPLIWISNISEESVSYDVKMTGAMRRENGFDYYTFNQQYLYNNKEGRFEEVYSYRNDKQRYYYDKEVGWILGNQVFTGDGVYEDKSIQDSYVRKQISSEYFDLYYNDSEMVIYDRKEEYLHKIIHLEKFDSDYVYDEYSNHKIEVLELTDKGEVNFAILGYQNSIEGGIESSINQKIGIGFYTYENGRIYRKGFIEKGLPISELETYLYDNTYYSQEAGKLYFWNEGSLYSLAFKDASFIHEGYFLKGSFLSSEGVILWQGSQEKMNTSVFVVNLQGQSLESYNLYRSGETKRLLGVGDGQVIVGVYELENTFEYLDQTIIYPYHRIDIYDFKGNLLESLTLESPYFYGDVYKNISDKDGFYHDNQMYVDVLKMTQSGRLKGLKVYFEVEDTLELPYLSADIESKLEMDEQHIELGLDAVQPEEIDGGVIQTTSDGFADKDIIYLTKSSFVGNHQDLLMDYEPVDVYEVKADGRTYYEESFNSSLLSSQDARQVTIEYIEELENQKVKTLMYDSKWRSQDQYLEDIVVIPQKPELPRGCEVTSLSILLHYYMEAAPDKIQLASELDQQLGQYAEIDGVIHFTDMHTAFAGSMDNTREPGLGVYIEPVYKLGKEYIDGNSVTTGAFDVSGLGFDQMLTLLSHKIPVLVIVPNRYRKVSDYAIEVWKTPSGFMEVTYQEHSVVVMGFDKDYIYYSDPSKNKIDRKPLSEFKEAWESIGSQGMIIFE